MEPACNGRQVGPASFGPAPSRDCRFTRDTSLVYKISIVSTLILALTGFVCTYKIQAEEECLSSNVMCYECDSRYDPNCADPFDLSSISIAEQQALAAAQANSNSSTNNNSLASDDRQQQRVPASPTNAGNSSGLKMYKRKYPNIATCHGCCVKITSKTPEGVTYVKRTCTTNLQINYFMVGLVCMKESGDRGKMCFCETDYCNGILANSSASIILVLAAFTVGLFVSLRLSPPAVVKEMRQLSSY